MYPNLYYAFKDIFGVEWNWLRIFNSFGFFVAIAFIAAAVVLTKELRRKERDGLMVYTEETIMVGRPASLAELFVNFLLGFLLGYKIIGLFTAEGDVLKDPQSFIFSSAGNLPAGILLGLLLAGLKWYEKNKQKLAKPEQRKIRIWPHDRVGDMVIFAAVFGFLGAKIFHNLENWDQLVRNPLESLISFDGLTFYGGLICAGLAIAWYARKHKIGFWHLGDSMAPALMIAYAIGRLGCQVSGDGDWGILNSAYVTQLPGKSVPADTATFRQAVAANQEFYAKQFRGSEVEHAPVKAPSFLPTWTVAYAYPHNVIKDGMPIPGCKEDHCYVLPVPVYPTPFYETVICTILFFFLWGIRKRIRTAGIIFGIYLILNGIERFFVEKIRVNTEYDIMGFHPTQAEIISFFLVLAGVLIILIRRKKRAPAA
ncbi:MAG TPA: prolipoprotein diacylglyceryl transferase family protein [Chitinophagaceae bacterium]|nr:prolipoprotein diacylglyceryl transferase family protein [Chitinophagaceae bacterium]